jgi:hypothetical protein
LCIERHLVVHPVVGSVRPGVGRAVTPVFTGWLRVIRVRFTALLHVWGQVGQVLLDILLLVHPQRLVRRWRYFRPVVLCDAPRFGEL